MMFFIGMLGWDLQNKIPPHQGGELEANAASFGTLDISTPGLRPTRQFGRSLSKLVYNQEWTT